MSSSTKFTAEAAKSYTRPTDEELLQIVDPADFARQCVLVLAWDEQAWRVNIEVIMVVHVHGLNLCAFFLDRIICRIIVPVDSS